MVNTHLKYKSYVTVFNVLEIYIFSYVTCCYGRDVGSRVVFMFFTHINPVGFAYDRMNCCKEQTNDQKSPHGRWKCDRLLPGFFHRALWGLCLLKLIPTFYKFSKLIHAHFKKHSSFSSIRWNKTICNWWELYVLEIEVIHVISLSNYIMLKAD